MLPKLPQIVAAAVLCCAASPIPNALAEEPLRRRADWGAGFAPPEDGQPARIVRFRPDSVLEKAGLKVGDHILELDGKPVTGLSVIGKFIQSKRAGDRGEFTVKRGAETIRATATAAAMPLEKVEGVEIRYGEARSAKGYRVRTYTSRPAGATGRLPVVVFIPWLSCGAVETPFGPGGDGWMKMLYTVMKESGAQVVRVEKPGVGDSEGPACSDSDLDHDLEAFRAGIRAALADPGADPARLTLFGGSIGGALAAVLATEFKPRAIVSAGSFSRTWYEHILGNERRRLVLSGAKPAEVNAAMKAFVGFYDLYLLQGLTPAQAIAKDARYAKVWTDEPAHQYGRPARYFQQVQALDVEGAWAATTAKALVVWGEHDWIMGREDQERVAAILGNRARLVVLPGVNHHFDRFPDAARAFHEEGGEFDAEGARIIAAWLRSSGAS